MILSTSGKEKTNVYAYMFLCDFFNFLLLIFGFSAFGVRNIPLNIFPWWIDINFCTFLDSTRGWRCDSLFTGKSSTHALLVNVVTAICIDSH